MKSRKNLFYIGMLTLCGICFTACSDDETYDVYGNPDNRVYIQDNSRAYKIVQTPISTVDNVDFKWVPRSSNKATGTIKVKVEVDNSLISAYNEEHGTEFEALPANAVVVENSEMTILAGEMVVSDTVNVKLTEDASILSTLKSEKGYIIPLRLVSAEGANSRLSTNRVSPSFLTITVTEDNMNHEATQYNGAGTLVADQSGWTVATNGSVSSWYDPINAIFDGNYETSTYITNTSGELQLDIDMGKACSFDGIKMTYQGYDSSWNYVEVGAFVSGMTVSISDNGTDWKSQGEIHNDTEVCAFYAPLTARYIRVTVPNAGGWYGATLQCGVFNIYAK